jgi:hypothetical protein
MKAGELIYIHLNMAGARYEMPIGSAYGIASMKRRRAARADRRAGDENWQEGTRERYGSGGAFRYDGRV